MILLVQASGMTEMGGSLVAAETIADEQRLSSLANALIGVSSFIINDLSFLELTNSLFRPTPNQVRVTKTKNRPRILRQKEGQRCFLGTSLLIVSDLDNHEQSFQSC